MGSMHRPCNAYYTVQGNNRVANHGGACDCSCLLPSRRRRYNHHIGMAILIKLYQYIYDTDFDHCGVILIDSRTGIPMILEQAPFSSKLTLEPFEDHLLLSSAHQIIAIPLLPREAEDEDSSDHSEVRNDSPTGAHMMQATLASTRRPPKRTAESTSRNLDTQMVVSRIQEHYDGASDCEAVNLLSSIVSHQLSRLPIVGSSSGGPIQVCPSVNFVLRTFKVLFDADLMRPEELAEGNKNRSQKSNHSPAVSCRTLVDREIRWVVADHCTSSESKTQIKYLSEYNVPLRTR